MNRQVVLASQSPRRRELLAKAGVDFIVEPSNFDEKLDDSRNMESVAIELALGKARDVAKRHPDALVIGSDTIVGIGGKQLEKPVDINEARHMLESYAGQKSSVSTGLAVVCKNLNLEITDVDTTYVYFKQNSDDIVRLREEYLQSGDWADKAGGYGIQSVGNTLIDRIEGNNDTVVGLPLAKLLKILNKLDIKIETPTA